jgi:hypothetical protein
MKIGIAIAFFTAVAILPVSALAQTLIYVNLDPLTGKVVRFSKAEMVGSTRDLIVQVAGQKRFVRLIYCRSNCGIDVPQRIEPLPEEMTTRGDAVWTFGVHGPESNWELETCSSVPKILKRGKRPMEVVFEKGTPFVPTPGQAQVLVPKPDTLPCYVIGDWSRAPGNAN